ncbi:hypothetical protein B0H63DRAFT_477190 [Podospora didyma]|uniref:Uncharacterized protein n=1 Tax=Podospora didyma TaxID=330526 RepID=A0AAE0NBP4_9PEZI|nr:hypothetical protein B0H63DRAFT_477190 [Podospora didyma]
MHLSAVLVSLLGATVMAADDLRPCGFKIAPCPPGTTCVAQDPKCPPIRGENCLGFCTPTKPTTTLSTKTKTKITSTKAPRPTYPPCGGFRIQQTCPEKDQICIDDPYSGGCGMACDAPGICVKPTFCGGIAGFRCADGKMCIDDPRDDCDVEHGGADCGGICV